MNCIICGNSILVPGRWEALPQFLPSTGAGDSSYNGMICAECWGLEIERRAPEEVATALAAAINTWRIAVERQRIRDAAAAD